MIYLITLNPAIDKYILVNDLTLNITNISTSKYDVFGGKAINVAKIVSQFTNDYEVITTIDKPNKEFVKNSTKDLNIKFFETSNIRENLKINDNSKITEINESVSDLDQSVIDKIEEYLLDKVLEEDYVLFAGSVHSKDMQNISIICKKLKTKKIIIDSASLNIDYIKDIKPFMIKPNDEEIQKLLGKEVDIKNGASKLVNLGVENVVVSLGGEGSYYKNQNQEYNILGIRGNVVNTVGAGDSFVGGFIVGSYLQKDLKDTLKLATACGSATAFSQNIAIKKDIEKLINQVKFKV